jgi:hypothetical protein
MHLLQGLLHDGQGITCTNGHGQGKERRTRIIQCRRLAMQLPGKSLNVGFDIPSIMPLYAWKAPNRLPY